MSSSSTATVEELRAEIQFRDKIIRKLELRILDKEHEIEQLRSDLDKVCDFFKVLIVI